MTKTKRIHLGAALLFFGALIRPVDAVVPTVNRYLTNDDAWFKTDAAKVIAANVLSWQSPLGGWPKNVDTSASVHPADKRDLEAGADNHPTYDNDATTGEMRFLAHLYNMTGDATYKASFEKGLNYAVEGQYPTGGWPQFYPPDDKYHRYVTFNDSAMQRLMFLLHDLSTDKQFNFLSAEDKQRAEAAFDKGVDYILKSQIKVNGKLTCWCAQHDPVTYEPRIGRAFELPSISGGESADIIRVLMMVDHPKPEVITAVDSAVAWLVSVELHGIRIDVVNDPKGPNGKNRVVVQDPKAPPLWARFYDLKTEKPLFSDRDGVQKDNITDIGYERRNGYRWIGDWPKNVIEIEYPAWKKRISAETASAK